jgi:hypothetical protein
VGIVAIPSFSQDLIPRAFVITPVGSKAVTVAYSNFFGSVFTDPTVPITDFRAQFLTQAFSYYHSISLLGRSANVTVSVPYALGVFRGKVAGAETRVYRSGLADLRLRFSLNLRGGPGMRLQEFLAWREKSVLGVSLTLVAPTGQYDPARLINPGLNRWALKPEVGFSKRWSRWSLDLYGGVWFSTANDRYFPGDSTRTQALIEAGEVHLTYYLNPRFWASLDVNYWLGGRTTLNGTEKFDYQRNSRAGATIVIPVTRHQSLKLAYSRGARIAIGGDFTNISMAWQYAWVSGNR